MRLDELNAFFQPLLLDTIRFIVQFVTTALEYEHHKSQHKFVYLE